MLFHGVSKRNEQRVARAARENIYRPRLRKDIRLLRARPWNLVTQRDIFIHGNYPRESSPFQKSRTRDPFVCRFWGKLFNECTCGTMTRADPRINCDPRHVRSRRCETSSYTRRKVACRLIRMLATQESKVGARLTRRSASTTRTTSARGHRSPRFDFSSSCAVRFKPRSSDSPTLQFSDNGPG